MKTFGTKERNKEYIKRAGAYGIAVKDNMVGVIAVRDFFFLVGGGIEADESPETCLKREVKEEIGYDIEIVKHLGSYREFHQSKRSKEYYEFLPEVFLIKLKEHRFDKVEIDHELVWMSKDEAKKSLLLEYQRAVIERLDE